MLKINDVLVLRNGKDVLDIKNIIFDLSKTYHIYGNTGAGKTTFFELVAGVEKPARGDVSVGDLSLYNSNFVDLSLLRKSFGVMFDVPGLISNQNVYENIKLAVESKKIKFDESLRKVIIESYLKNFEMERIIDERPGVLSTDQKKIAAFIRAIITNPKFLIFDGFTDFLSGPYRDKKIQLLNNMKNKKVGGLFLSKDKQPSGIEFDYYFELKNGSIYEC